MKTGLGLILAFLLCMPDVHANSIAASANLERHADGTAIHLSLPISNTLNARFGFNNYVINNSLTIPSAINTYIDTVTFGVKRKVDNYDVLLDWFPFNNYFRVTSGVIFSNLTTIILGKPNWQAGYTTGNGISTQLVSHVRETTTSAPYIGFGLGLPNGRSYKSGLSLDIGIIFLHPPSIIINGSRCTTSHVQCQQVMDVISNQKQQIDQYFDHRRYFMVRAGLTYRF